MPAKLRMSRDDVHREIQDSIDRYSNWRYSPHTSKAERETFLAAYRTWDEFNKRLLDRAFTSVSLFESSPRSEYSTLQDIKLDTLESLDDENMALLLHNADEKKRRLESILSSLSLYEEEVPTESTSNADNDNEPNTREESPEKSTIFLIHGRDTSSRETVHRFVSEITSAQVVTLSEMPNKGQTIIEKFSTHMKKSSYAIVIATGDDEGRLKSTDDFNLRARQNVIFELGFAFASLGRENVAVLYQDGVELPSDAYGIAYTELDAKGAWKLELMGELKAAGIDIDTESYFRNKR
ncbi:putative nucleotide-binding protein [Spinactinospora alkalitolerans]|uniref:Putative nucleotide-binding protein n=1 Tax=Spinactinospora alkalitolerans TaxID=687207 RepID=A0A852U3W2_9ACTN|nr:nucleotide-binding protein [Spinactinospora alkalitolerans]NYE50879.1 putative nucleotide-binding protein [Spinactinospora alkalitolerans]